MMIGSLILCCILGTGVHFKSFISFVNQNQWLPQVFSAFMMFWLTAFVIGFGQLVLGKFL
jgi:hypothetical protein